ncbi:LytR/AlgR family response regulator transcription factor [Mongoliitalea lutea]|uniref:DNA-binding response regulator n=1 Tax=Mongoliitalea lutea TaxID=849756 RepID=A0A8J3D1K0_9BACT|nr:LytTR family DNA-binding domain-containing protein [Mongoliitalea lutea]GHB49727.1 DNA-binding response regulator [Mongoliitalea lutea]
MSNGKIRYLIIDDDLVSATLLREYLKSFKDLYFKGILDNTGKALEIIENDSIDLLFLDIEMPGDNGLIFLSKLAIDVLVVFVTSKPKYALSAFDYNPVHFLTKPLDKGKLEEAIRRVYARFYSTKTNTVDLGYLVLKDKSNYIKIPFKELVFVEAAADYMIIHTIFQNYIFHITMKDLTSMLSSEIFVRVHRSFLINKTFVTKMEKDFIQLHDKKIPIGPKFRKEILGGFQV